jgi:AmiR/NasT family two-component response regulator
MAPLYDDARKVAGVLANVFDLTAREAATANLQIALESNRRIGTAVGILMAHRRIRDSAAFELLRVASQRAHRKLREIAEDVVLTGALPEDH